MMYIKDKMIGRLRVQVNEEEMEEIGIIWYMVFVLSVNTWIDEEMNLVCKK